MKYITSLVASSCILLFALLMSSELSFSSSVNEHDVISTSFKLWFLACDSLTLIVSYHRHTGFIRTLLMLARLKFSNLVLPTVSS